MKKKSKLIIGVILFILILAGVAFFIVRNSIRNQIVAFYGLSEKTVTGIKSEIEKTNNLNFQFVDFTNEKQFESVSLEKNLNSVRPALIFTTSGKNLKIALENASKKAAISVEKTNISEMTSSIRSIIPTINNKISAVPILNNHLEIDIDKPAFNSSGMERIATWEDIEQFARIQKNSFEYPIIFAGGDYDISLDIFGALIEAFNGYEEYKKAVELVNGFSGKKFNAAKVAKLLCEENDSALNKPFRFLKNLQRNELIHPDVFSLSKKDVNAFMKARLSSVVIMTLEDHRNCDEKAISRYSSIYFPSTTSDVNRNFTAPVIFAVPLTNKFGVQSLINSLSSVESEERLSRGTGLAPVLNVCRTPDKQASDARHWVAASGSPLAGFCSEIDLTENQKKELCNELIQFIISK